MLTLTHRGSRECADASNAEEPFNACAGPLAGALLGALAGALLGALAVFHGSRRVREHRVRIFQGPWLGPCLSAFGFPLFRELKMFSRLKLVLEPEGVPRRGQPLA